MTGREAYFTLENVMNTLENCDVIIGIDGIHVTSACGREYTLIRANTILVEVEHKDHGKTFLRTFQNLEKLIKGIVKVD